MPDLESSVTPEPRAVRVAVVAGVAGSGKTTVGRALAARLGWAFEDADAFHSPAAMEKMSRGEGLTDADRVPWLSRLAALVDERRAEGPPTVLACSALTPAYRQALGVGRPGVALVWLHVPPEVLRQRLATREGHRVGTSLLPSQLATAHPPGAADRVSAARPLAEVVEAAVRRVLGQPPA